MWNGQMDLQTFPLQQIEISRRKTALGQALNMSTIRIQQWQTKCENNSRKPILPYTTHIDATLS